MFSSAKTSTRPIINDIIIHDVGPIRLMAFRASPLYVLGAICGSSISMDLLAQSMDPYSAQKSMDCADICGSLRVVTCAVRGKYSPARQRYYRTRVCCAISVVIFLDSLHYMFGQLFPTYQSGAKRKCVIIVILRYLP